MKTKTLWLGLFIVIVLVAWILLSPGFARFHINVPFTTITPTELTLYGIHIPRTDLVDAMMIVFQIITFPLFFFTILGMDKKLAGKDTDIRIFIWVGLVLLVLGLWLCAVMTPYSELGDSIESFRIRALEEEIITRQVIALTGWAGIFLAIVKFPKSKNNQ